MIKYAYGRSCSEQDQMKQISSVSNKIGAIKLWCLTLILYFFIWHMLYTWQAMEHLNLKTICSHLQRALIIVLELV